MKKLLAVLLALMMVLLSVNLATAEGTAYVKVGDIVTFGHYPQTAEGTDETPIEWIVLDVRGGKALVISRYALDSVPYNTEEADVSWKTCSLRAWLNNDFLNAAFNPEEQAAIPVTEVDNSAAHGYNQWPSEGGDNTKDKVFLLSYAEANWFLSVTRKDYNNIKARIAPTEYASSRALINGFSQTADGTDAGWWWLRSSGYFQDYAAVVNNNGSLGSSGVNDEGICVRPALWINLDSETFKSENPQYEHESQAEIEAEPTGVKAGDIISFGQYPQTAEGMYLRPIEWCVLEVKDGKALVISRYGLDVQRYQERTFHSVTWETCSLRAWLNDEFLNTAFSPEEQAAIPETEVDNSAEQGFSEWYSIGGNNTQDRIFLLSLAEACRYFGLIDVEENIKARVAPTAYTVSKGIYTDRDSKTEDGIEAVYWWLRSPGYTQYDAACVGAPGVLRSSIADFENCVRPAMWLDLDSDIFKSENP